MLSYINHEYAPKRNGLPKDGDECFVYLGGTEAEAKGAVDLVRNALNADLFQAGLRAEYANIDHSDVAVVIDASGQTVPSIKSAISGGVNRLTFSLRGPEARVAQQDRAAES